MSTPSNAATTHKPSSLDRSKIPDRFTWNLTDIYPDWATWEQSSQDLEAKVAEYAAMRGTLAKGPEALLSAFRLSEAMGQIAGKVAAFASMSHDEDQRDNAIAARRQQVDILIANWIESAAWFKPELLEIPLDTIRKWLEDVEALRIYRFAIEDLYRQQEHVLDSAGERLMSLTMRVGRSATDSYSALSTADVTHPTITLADGTDVVVSYGNYRSILATKRDQSDRAKAYTTLHDVYRANLNTYASLYNGVLQGDLFEARARDYAGTLEASLHGDNVPTSVVENLIATTRKGVEPMRRYHRLRKRVLGLDAYHIYDEGIPLVDYVKQYDYPDVREWLVESTERLGPTYQERMREGLNGGWIDVYENEGKRSGAYSQGVYGVHPYMLLNFNDTLDAVFTLAHEMGHSMHTILSDEHQPYIYHRYTIFVAEVPSTLSEALLLELMLKRTDDPRARIVLLQHAIDGILGTFYRQVLFADYELQAHRLVEEGKPITGDVLSDLYQGLLEVYYGDTIDYDDHVRTTWARIPHFFHYSFYVYQYATCYASSAQLAKQMRTGSDTDRQAAVDRYLALLQSGGNDYPMEQLKKAGVDLSVPEPVEAVVAQLDTLVGRLEQELATLGNN